MAVKREKIHFASVDELLGVPEIINGTEEIEIDRIHPFKDHPFKVLDDDRMNDLVESIKENGVLSPVLVRSDDMAGYEMISGHRRLHAAKRAGLDRIPVIVKELNDDEAVIAMVDSNVQREEILPSERAWSLKMKREAISKQGERNDLTSGTQCQKSSAEAVGEVFGLKERQVRKYIKLTELRPEILEMVDEKKLTVNFAVELAYFDQTVQQWLMNYRKQYGVLMPEQLAGLKAKINEIELSEQMVENILNVSIPKVKVTRDVSLKEKQLNKYFPEDYSAKQREQIIIELLEQWSQSKGDI